jgi:hypothetical protein
VAVTISARLTRDAAHLDTDFLTLTATPAAPASTALSIHYRLIAIGAVSFSSPAGKVSVKAGATSGRRLVIVYFPPLVGNQTLVVKTSGVTASGSTTVPSPSKLALAAASPFGAAPTPGYWMTTANGAVYAFAAPSKGALTKVPASPIVGMAESPTGNGYWLVTSSGTVYSFGVPFRGSLTSKPVAPIVAIASDPATGGYWLFGRNGAVYAFDAPKFGELTAAPPAPVASAGAAPDGLGYWMTTATGVVFAFGRGAHYYGGASGDLPGASIVSFAPDLRTGGYWLLTGKGVVYAFHAPYLGSATGQAATSITPDPATSGYWISTANGGVFSFGAKFYGSAAPYHPSAVVTILGR